MKIYAFTFYKDKYSTKIPTGTGTAIDVRLKDGCSILSPRFRITSGSWPETANYIRATIAGRTRYYYVEDVDYETNNDRIVTCSYDYAAANRSIIFSTTQYVVRTSDATKYDPRVTDASLMTENRALKLEKATTGATFTLTGGVYILGVLMSGISNPVLVRGAVTYIAMTDAQLYAFINGILTITTAPTIFSSYSPIQYVASCVYIPFSIGTLTSGSESVTFGNYSMTLGYSYVTELRATNGLYKLTSQTIELPEHPDKSTFGDFVNVRPFSHYKMYAASFGDFDLDPELIVATNTIDTQITIDVTDGSAVLTVSSGGKIMKQRGMLGVPTALAQIVSNPLLGVANVAMGAASSMASIAMGNVVGGVGSLVSAGLSAIENMIPRVTQKGMNGSIAEFNELKLNVVGEFYRICDNPVNYIGRPCYKVLTLSTLAAGSYVRCADVKIEVPGYSSEQDEVKRMLEHGIFLE